MKTRTKLLMSVTALILCCVLLFLTVTISKTKASSSVVGANTRTVELSESGVDFQSVLNEFDNAKLSKDGSTAYFEGFKALDSTLLSEIDYISETDFENLENCTVKYNFSYNSETNIVTLAAAAELPDGKIEVDEIHGVGFLNDKNEIDAVMNVDGEGILLSEMRDAGMIQNCGWLSKLVKAAKIIAGVALCVAAAALIVVTAGVAAPAVVAAGLGITAAVTATAATIATYATITAVIAAGVALTAATWEEYYPGIDVTTTTSNGTQVFTASWSKNETKKALKDLVQAEKSKKDPAVYFHVTRYNQSNGPITVELKGYTKNEMSSNMASLSWSSLTYSESLAISVLNKAFPTYKLSSKHDNGMQHYHKLAPGDFGGTCGSDGRYRVHSYFTDLLAV